jgi:hypothetical protein
MVKPGHQHGLALKAIAEFGIRRDVLVHHFDDDIPPEIELAGQVDPTHSPFSEDASRLVPTQEYTTDHEQARSASDLDEVTGTNLTVE